MQTDESQSQSRLSNEHLTKSSLIQSKDDKSLLLNQPEIEKTQTQNILQTDVEYSKSEVISKIGKIFLNNAKFNSKENDFFLSQQSVNAILIKSGIISKTIIQLPDIDVLFKLAANSRTKINLKEFINFFIKLTQRLYPAEFKVNPKMTTNYVFNCFFGNYNKVLEEKTSQNFINSSLSNNCTIHSIEKVITAKLDEKTIYVLNSLYQPIKSLYEVYFSNELTKGGQPSESIQQQSLKNLISFCKDFEVFPYLLNETQVVTYFNFILKFSLENPEMNNMIIAPPKDIGKCYKLSLFYFYFYHFALVFYYKQLQMNFPEKKEPNVNILLFFLEKLENSQGIRRFSEKKYRTNSLQFSLIPKQSVLDYIREAKDDHSQDELRMSNNNQHQNQQQLQQSSIMNHTNNTYGYKSNTKEQEETVGIDNKSIDFKKVLSITPEVMQLLEDNYDVLCEAFLTYSRINDKISFSKMSLSSYIKFLKDADIISAIPPEHKELYSTLGTDLMKKTLNICSIKKYNSKENKSISVASPELTEEQKNYRKCISEIVNSNKTSENKISEGDANVIYKTIINHNECKMNFVLFIKSFELIAVKLFPEQKTMSDSFEKLLRVTILPKFQQNKISQNSSEIKEALYKINNDKIKDFLIQFSKVVEPIFKEYSDMKERMVFANFFGFYKAFSLFPDMIKLNKLKYIFFTLCDSNPKDQDMKHEHINFSLFLESLAISAMFFNFKNMMTDMDKMLYLVERIYQSPGAGAFIQIHKTMIEFLNKMKKEYPLSLTYKNQVQDTKRKNSPQFENIYNEEDNNSS